jgi:hypothetical protein
LGTQRGSGCDVIAYLPQIQLKLQADDTGVSLDIAEAEVGVLAILDLGNATLTAAELGGHLRLGETSGHPGDDKLVDEPGLDRELANGIGYPAIAMSAEHLIDAAIGTLRGGGTAGDGLK